MKETAEDSTFLKVTTENLTNWTLLEHEKPPKTIF